MQRARCGVEECGSHLVAACVVAEAGSLLPNPHTDPPVLPRSFVPRSLLQRALHARDVDARDEHDRDHHDRDGHDDEEAHKRDHHQMANQLEALRREVSELRQLLERMSKRR